MPIGQHITKQSRTVAGHAPFGHGHRGSQVACSFVARVFRFPSFCRRMERDEYPGLLVTTSFPSPELVNIHQRKFHVPKRKFNAQFCFWCVAGLWLLRVREALLLRGGWFFRVTLQDVTSCCANTHTDRLTDRPTNQSIIPNHTT